jgi:hypothetical protein
MVIPLCGEKRQYTYIHTWKLIIQFNSVLYYLCAKSTAARPITDRAQGRYKIIII